MGSGDLRLQYDELKAVIILVSCQTRIGDWLELRGRVSRPSRSLHAFLFVPSWRNKFPIMTPAVNEMLKIEDSVVYRYKLYRRQTLSTNRTD